EWGEWRLGGGRVVDEHRGRVLRARQLLRRHGVAEQLHVRTTDRVNFHVDDSNPDAPGRAKRSCYSATCITRTTAASPSMTKSKATTTLSSSTSDMSTSASSMAI